MALVGICDWPNTEMARSKMLPDDAKSVEEHGHRNRAYLEIVRGIRRIVRSVRQEKGKAQAEIDRLAAEKAKAAMAKRIERRKKAAAKSGTDKRRATEDVIVPKAASRPSPAATQSTTKKTPGLQAKPPGKASRPPAKRSTRKNIKAGKSTIS